MLRRVSSDRVPSPPPPWIADLCSDGLDVVWTGAGHGWMRFRRHAHLRYPTNDVAPVTTAERREMFRHRRLVLQHHHRVEDPARANACLYLCEDPDYSLDGLSSNNRSKVRRGLKRLDVRQVEPSEVAASGYPAYSDTRGRHGMPHMTSRQFTDLWGPRRLSASHEVWGAIGPEGIVAFGEVHLCGRWASLSATVSADRALRDYPNQALFFTLLSDLMGRPGIESVSYGLSSLRPETGRDSLHRFKESVGLAAVPVRREITLHPVLKPLVNPVSARAVAALERRRPESRLPRAARSALDMLRGTTPPDAPEVADG
ncbi:hypothetical protein BH24ACT4_BH24ACT4_01200 [soil metagenome]